MEVEVEDRLQEGGERDGLEDLLGNSTDSGEEDVREEEVKGVKEVELGAKEVVSGTELVQEAEKGVEETERESEAEMEVVAAGSVDLFQETQGEEGGEVEAAEGVVEEEEPAKEAATAPATSLTSGQQGAASSFSSLSLTSEESGGSCRGQEVAVTSWQGVMAFLARQEEVLEGGSTSQLGELGRNLGQGLARVVQLQCKLVEKLTAR